MGIQLCLFTIPIAYMGTLSKDDPVAATEGMLHGFNWVTWLVITINCLGGMLVAVVMKYAGNILRNFAQALAIVCGEIGSYFMFDFEISMSFSMGSALVISSIFMYGYKPSEKLA